MVWTTAMEKVTATLNHFAEGNPLHEEIEIADGVFFSVDMPFADDLMQPKIPIAVQIEGGSPHNHHEPEERTLEDYGDGFYADLVCILDEAIYNAGSRNEEVVMEYSAHNSNPEKDFYVFLGAIQNPRVAINQDGKPVKAEGY